MKYISIFLLCLSSSIFCQSKLPIEANFINIANGFLGPTHLTHAGDERLFVCEQFGLIKIIEADQNVMETPFLDLRSEIFGFGERGLLSMAFHPNFKDNKLFYVCYNNQNGETQVSSFLVSPDDPNVALLDSEQNILSVDIEDSNFHIGGCLQFGPDGYLYISTGDAVVDIDLAISQDGRSLLGKILRIDVDNGEPYSIPIDNPFVNDETFRDEIWAYGLRNPWKFSFDKVSGDMWITDVGFKEWEEINYISAGETSGKNFGWPCYEANTEIEDINCDLPNHHLPSAMYAHSDTLDAASISGGYVYRGLSQELNELNAYIYGDYVRGTITALYKQEDAFVSESIITPPELINPSAIGQDVNGELYAVDYRTGIIFLIDFRCNMPRFDITTMSCIVAEDGCIELDIPDNENIESVTILDPSDQIVEESDYCNLMEGHYTIVVENRDAMCPQKMFFEIKEYKPSFRRTPATCESNADGCVEINIPKLSDKTSYRIESENGTIIDTSNYCNLFSGDYAFIISYDLIDCSTFDFSIGSRALSVPITINLDTLFVVDTFSIYQWIFRESFGSAIVEIPNTNMHFYIPDQGSGLYRVDGFAEDGCPFSSRSYNLQLSATEEIIAQNQVLIAPNPVSDKLTLTFLSDVSNDIELSIIDVNGNTLYQESLEYLNQKEYSVDIRFLDPSVYFLSINDKGRQSITKFVKL